ncbi:glycosyltransferase family 4 protein [Sellimonas catena]|uniref:Glycosyltransferase EpsD n=1 Tax=Sellimonas catena TaxID=2994035 RepID=A0A9W6CCP2_9FIRM|nr:glycosyltransferase family 4 protein [Sellimonas catena]GLG91698.1 putative glycosyltransferase EpsD [Sellimonas catena]
MRRRILITSTDLMMVQFLVPHVINLAENGYEVEVACSDVGGRIDEVRKKLELYTKAVYVIRLHRSPFNPDNVKGYYDLKCIINKKQYDIIWTNEPVMGVVTRLAVKKKRRKGTKVLYMVHGFHFFDGAPKLNWMIYYPVERLMASMTDVICTINQEDYRRAKNFNVKKVVYIHGIGINTARLTPSERQNDIRKELGLKDNDFIVLSVGELNENKNQKVIIKALAKLNVPEIHYVLCGKGEEFEHLRELAVELHLERQVHFLGYRTDVVDICSQADVFVMPSRREGLPVASLEAMYCGLPLLTSNIRGLVDVMGNGVSGYMYNPTDIRGFAEGIKRLKLDSRMRCQMGKNNQKNVKPYCIKEVKKEVLTLINSL